MRLRAVVIADDLTGALELGALLAGRRWRALVSWGEAAGEECDGWVADTRSRHLTPQAAALRVATVARDLPADVPLFKKVDSTLRGNVEAELDALRLTFPGRQMVFTPAYPALGRVVRGGVLYVGGVPVAETEFARDPRTRALRSTMAGMLDAGSDADLAAIRAPLGAIWAGAGGLGRVWVSRLPLGDVAEPIVRMVRPLLVCGSRHAASRGQAERARGCEVLLPPEGLGEPEEILEELGRAAAARAPEGLILFGGDTAAAVLAALGVRRLWPVKELLPGVVLSRTDDGRAVVTKAGGFGEPDVVERIFGLLQ